MKYSDISKCRTNIMGISIMAIMIYHTTVKYPYFLDLIKNFGDIGVNLFLVISGFSMYYSWMKNPQSEYFIKNRFLRIIISYLPIAIVWCFITYLLNECSLKEAIFKILTLQFWIDGNLLHWFVSAILLFYLITPFWMKLQRKNSNICLFVTISVCFISIAIDYFNIVTYIPSFLYRVPSYFLGLYLGKYSFEDRDVSKFQIKLLLSMGIIGVAGIGFLGVNALDYDWKYLIYVIISYPMVMLLTIILMKTKSLRINKVVSFLGVITLEIYLLHEKILRCLTMLLEEINISLDANRITINILSIVITLFSAKLYHSITSPFYEKSHKNHA